MIESFKPTHSRRIRWYQKRIMLAYDAIFPCWRPTQSLIVAGMATMPTRSSTFQQALKSILRQVDKVYLYLDGHTEPPAEVRDNKKIVCMLSRDYPGLKANGKFLGLVLEQNPCLYISVDDDIYYCRDYVYRLCKGLGREGRKTVVGYHGTILAQPLKKYRDRTILVFSEYLPAPTAVDVLGSGTTAFWTDVLRFDVRDWNFTNMVDLGLAIEAAKRGLPLICLSRRANLAMPLAGAQDDSVYARLRQDDSRQTELAHELLRLRGHSDPQTAPGSGNG